MATTAPNGINVQLSIALATASGATASLQCTTLADTPETACIAGTDGLEATYFRLADSEVVR